MRLHPDVELLLEIQDLLAFRRTMESTDPRERDPIDDAAAFAAKIATRTARLTPRTRATYDRLASRLEQIIVPVVNGVCNACRIRVPTETITAVEVRACPSCGRFLYSTD
ncbi:MAG: hypothetical protein ABJD07_09295 [Gemmatimonadaceae bacterium]